jgi:hypothetical protein
MNSVALLIGIVYHYIHDIMYLCSLVIADWDQKISYKSFQVENGSLPFDLVVVEP